MDLIQFDGRSMPQTWASWSVSSFIATAVLLAIISLVAACLKRRLSPGAISLLFFLVLLKPFIPIQITLPAAIAVRSTVNTAELASVGDFQSGPAKTVQQTTHTDLAVTPEGTRIPNDTLAHAPVETKKIVLASTLKTADSFAAPPSSDSASMFAQSTWPMGSLLAWRTVLLLAYIVLAGLLLIRFCVRQIRFHHRVRQSRQVDLNELQIDIAELCSIAGLSRIPRVVEMPVSSPAVWGLFRQTLILPTDFPNELSDAAIRWTVLHELAHLRRHDLTLHAIQRLSLIFQFWNPFAWIASHYVNRFREQACDDMALVWAGRDGVAAGEAFMQVVQSTLRLQRPSSLATSLGIFSSGGKRACKHRLSRLLDSERQLSDRVSTAAFALVCIMALTLLPQHQAAVSAPPEAAESESVIPEPSEEAGQQSDQAAAPAARDAAANAAFVSAKESGSVQLVVVGPNGQPVPSASVEIRPRANKTWKILQGSFERDRKYGTMTQTDTQGRLKLDLSNQKLRALTFSIKANGFAPFWASWSTGDELNLVPARYVARLDAGQSYGGIIVDQQGQPVEGVTVQPSIEYKKRETDESQLGSGWTTKTDADGKWRCDFAPAAESKLFVQIAHDQFAPIAISLRKAEYSLALGEQPKQKIELRRGISLTGTVTDNKGNPISDASVRSLFINELREVKTDADGNYTMPGCPVGTAAVTITAKGRAPDQRMVDFQTGLKPIDFRLTPGNTVRVKIVDAEGAPMKKARVFFQKWRGDRYGKGLATVHQYTDDNGEWVWNEAPADEFVVTLYPRGCLEIADQKLVARDEEYRYVATPQLTVVGRVTDAVTGKLIPSFRIIPGMLWSNQSLPHWMRREGQDGRDGAFTRNLNRVDGTHLFRIEADGYTPAISREVKPDEGEVKLSFELQPAKSVSINVTRPDSSNATGAEAVIGIESAQIHISNGKFRSGTYGKRVNVDSNGVLQFESEGAPVRLVVLDETGYADLLIEPGSEPKRIRLIAWASIDGTYFQGSKPASGLALSISPNQSRQSLDVPDILWSDRVTTDQQGKFRLARARPGEISLQQTHPSHRTNGFSRRSYSYLHRLEAGEGQRVSLRLGGDGAQVRGKTRVNLPGEIKPDWEFSHLEVVRDLGPPPQRPNPDGLEGEAYAAWYKTWSETDAGKQFKSAYKEYSRGQLDSFVAKISGDGSFVVHDLPPGKFVLAINLDSRPDPTTERSDYLGSGDIKFEVPSDAKPNEVIELGVIEITDRPRKPGIFG